MIGETDRLLDNPSVLFSRAWEVKDNPGLRASFRSWIEEQWREINEVVGNIPANEGRKTLTVSGVTLIGTHHSSRRGDFIQVDLVYSSGETKGEVIFSADTQNRSFLHDASAQEILKSSSYSRSLRMVRLKDNGAYDLTISESISSTHEFHFDSTPDV